MKLIFLSLLILFYFISIVYLSFGDIYSNTNLGVFFFICASVLVLTFVFSDYFKKFRERFTFLSFVLFVSIIVRLIYFNLEPSDDVARYAIEGKNINQGINPYIKAPIWFTSQDFILCSDDTIQKLRELQKQVFENIPDNKKLDAPSEIANALIQRPLLVQYINNAEVLLKNFKEFPQAEDNLILKNRFLLSEYLSLKNDHFMYSVNHVKMPSIYPPFALNMFSLLTKIWYSKFIFKTFFLICDLAIIVLIFTILKINKLSIDYVWLYTLMPIVLFYGVGECHLDVLQNVLLLFAMYFCIFCNNKIGFVFGYLFFGCAILTKYIAVVLLPIIIKSKNVYYSCFLFLPFLMFIPYFEPNMFNSLLQFSFDMHFADVVPRILRIFFAPGTTIYSLSMLFILIFGFAIIVLIYQSNFRAMLLLWIWLLLCLPVNHPWYLLTAIMLTSFRPTLSILYLCVVASIYFYIKAYQISSQGEWYENNLYFILMILSYIVFIMFESFFQKSLDNKIYEIPNSLDIVVPILNEEKNLPFFLTSLTHAIHKTPEIRSKKVSIICVDGGSIDKSVEICKSYGCQVVIAKKRGRGYQLQNGFDAGASDLVLFLHADSTLEANSISELFKQYEYSPNLVWGVLGQKFESSKFSLRFVQLLNHFRFIFLGIAFGDQGIFCRREVLKEVHVPPQSLMEDIELSLRLGDKGRRLYLGSFLVSNSRHWLKVNFFKRFFLIIRICLLYLFWRRIGLNTEILSDKLYTDYYQKKK